MRKAISASLFFLLFLSLLCGRTTASHLGNAYMKGYTPMSLPQIDWTHYHNYTEIATILIALNQTYPNIIDVFSIGKSWQNRGIYCVRLTNETDSRQKPEIFFDSYHHAREQITAELALYFVVYAATNFGSNATVTRLLNGTEIYVVVAVNVDGFDAFKANDWQRKNARPINDDHDALVDEDPPEDEDGDGLIEYLMNKTLPGQYDYIRTEGFDNDGDSENGEDWIGGVDLNRNYDYKWEMGNPHETTEIYRGPAPFSEPETQAIRNLVLQHHFKYALDFHSGTELIVYPWSWTRTPPADETKFIEIAQDLSSLTGGTEYEQSSYLYYAYGTWDDWMYGVAQVKALTCEIFANSTWEGVVHPGPYPGTVWEGWVRYAFNPFPEGIESIVLRWLPVFFYIANRTVNEDFHDVAVRAITPEKAIVGQGFSSILNVTVENAGSYSEIFNVTAYANFTPVRTQLVTVDAGAVKTVALQWNTVGFAKANYIVSAYAWLVIDEKNATDNTFVAEQIVRVVMPGDADSDKQIGILDVVKVTARYGAKRVDANYDPNVDWNDDGDINILDVVIVTSRYGLKDP